METVGIIAPKTPAEARRTYDAVGPPAQVVVREVARAMEFDPEEYDSRVSPAVVETARDALFASLLTVTVGDREEYLGWRKRFDGEVFEAGSEHVDRVVWHAFDGKAVAATFAEEREAAIATLQRQAFGRLYRDVVTPADKK